VIDDAERRAGREQSSAVVDRSDRGQLVLLAAVALAVALVPLVVAYLQLGYQEDITAPTDPVSMGQAETTLDRAVHDASSGVPANYSWDDRSQAVGAVRSRLASTIAAITTVGLDRQTAYEVTYNGTRAASWASNNCPGGPDRAFGPCVADRGVVVQERGGRTHVLAAAFDLDVTAPSGEYRLSTTVERLSG
jgi:hypothetical protein